MRKFTCLICKKPVADITICCGCRAIPEPSVPAPSLVWSDAKPTVPGWYWWKNEDDNFYIVWYSDDVFNVSGRVHGAKNISGQFAGPIPEPEEVV